MNRRTAIAGAAAVTMTFLSGVVALGAGTGTLGLGSPPTAAVASQTPPATSRASTDQPVTVTPGGEERDDDDSTRAHDTGAYTERESDD